MGCIRRLPILRHEQTLRPPRSMSGTRAAYLAVLLTAGLNHSVASAQDCSRADFEQVVDKAALALAELNAQKTPPFQMKLRDLKTKRGWSQAEFIKQGTPFVQDDQIADFDSQTGELLAKITDKGELGASAATPDCKLLGELRATMQALIDTQGRKWDYMFNKIDKALKE